MKSISAVIGSLLGIGIGGPLLSGVMAQTEYTGDGIPTAIEEEIRWLTNRARYNRAQENATRGTSYTDVPATAGPLAPSQSLTLAARHHSEDMALKNKFQHPTVPGSAYYNASTQPQPWDRLTAEGYGSYLAVAENISAGYPTAEAAYVGWWKSSGHRVNQGSAAYREIGNGYFYRAASSYGHYYTMDLGGRSISFFTDTIFSDTNSNGKYDQGEGLNNVRVSLRVQGNTHASYDVSAAPGSFAVSLSGIAQGAAVEVLLTNQRTAAATVSVPRSYSLNDLITLAAGESRVIGTVPHPGSLVNLGFRNLTASQGSVVLPVLTLVRSGATSRISWMSQSGLQYLPQWSPNLTAWTDFSGGYRAGNGALITVSDTTTTGVLKRYYRVVVRRP